MHICENFFRKAYYKAIQDVIVRLEKWWNTESVEIEDDSYYYCESGIETGTFCFFILPQEIPITTARAVLRPNFGNLPEDHQMIPITTARAVLRRIFLM